ncbi:hypothetical protein ES702_05446 [subsurface metagenome]
MMLYARVQMNCLNFWTKGLVLVDGLMDSAYPAALQDISSGQRDVRFR